MADDPRAATTKGCLGFAQSRAGALLASSLDLRTVSCLAFDHAACINMFGRAIARAAQEVGSAFGDGAIPARLSTARCIEQHPNGRLKHASLAHAG